MPRVPSAVFGFMLQKPLLCNDLCNKSRGRDTARESRGKQGAEGRGAAQEEAAAFGSLFGVALVSGLEDGVLAESDFDAAVSDLVSLDPPPAPSDLLSDLVSADFSPLRPLLFELAARLSFL